QPGLSANSHHAIQALIPLAMRRFAAGLLLDLLPVDLLLAVDAGAIPTVDRGEVGIVAAMAFVAQNAIRLEADLVALRLAVRGNFYSPFVPFHLAQPAGVQQWSLAAAVRAGHLPDVEQSGLVILRPVEKRHYFRALLAVVAQSLPFGFWQGRERRDIRHLLADVLDEF